MLQWYWFKKRDLTSYLLNCLMPVFHLIPEILYVCVYVCLVQ